VYLSLFVWLFLLSSFSSWCQPSFTQEVWTSFYRIVTLPADEQIRCFAILQDKCKKQGLTTDSTYTNLLFLFGAARWTKNQPEVACSLLKEAITIGSRYPIENPVRYLSKYHFYLGYYQESLGFYESAIQHYNLAYALGLKQQTKWGIPSMACHRLSHLYYEIQDYRRGLAYANFGAQLARRQDDIVNLTKNLYEQCVNLNELENTQTFNVKIDSLRRLAEVYATGYEKALYYKFFGDIAFKNREYPKAKMWFLKSAELFKTQNDWSALGDIYIDLNYLSALTDDKAMTHYHRLALRYSNNPYNLSRLYNNNALWLKRRGQFNDALENLQHSLIVLPITFDPNSVYENPTAAQLKNLPQKDYAFTPLLDKAEILSLDKSNKSHLRHALNTYLLLDTLVDHMRWQHQELATKLFWREKLNSLYEQAMETCYQLKDEEGAFYFMEKSRSALLLDELNRHAARTLLPKKEAEKESALRMQVKRYQNDGEYKDQLQHFLQAQAQLDEYVKNLERRYPRYYEWKYNNEVPKLELVQAYLAQGNQCLLNYYEGKKGIYLLVVNSRGKLLKKVDPLEYYPKREELDFFLRNSRQFSLQYDRYLQVSNRFYQLFFLPLKSFLTSRIIISTSGEIIPFAALSASASRADYLVNYYAFSYSYSVRTLLSRQIPLSTKSSTYFLGVAPVHFPYKKDLASLPASTSALETNRKLFYSSLLLMDKKAKKTSFQQKWPQAKVVQLISHANADPKSAEPTIYLADTSLSLKDIHQQQIQTQLLLLSACRTGIGKMYTGEGVFSLSRGFMATGVPSIISTLWDIDDQDAYTFSHEILTKIAKQAPFDVAVQQAQQEWLAEADRSGQLPNAWAGFVLLGTSGPLASEPFTYVTICYALALCLLLKIGVVWWWFKGKKLKKESGQHNG